MAPKPLIFDEQEIFEDVPKDWHKQGSSFRFRISGRFETYVLQYFDLTRC